VSGRSKTGRSTRRSSRGALGQHFLASSALAARLVADAAITRADRVIDIGAGNGALTAALADTGARVFAIEVDRVLAAALTRRFADQDHVTVFACDALTFPLPATPHRVLANPPFGHTAALLHHLLDDPTGGLVRADLVVQWQVARLRARVGDTLPWDLLGVSWAPWWVFRRGRRLPASLFRPAPSVDAAVLTVSRRADPTLAPAVAPAFRAFVRSHFGERSAPPTVGGWVDSFNLRSKSADEGCAGGN
jgi:23S rRNA (adenine-N6)-dimethyltransferase